MKENIFLIGFMGTGKTTVSRRLSGLLGYREIDLDQEIEERQNRKISEIFAAEGEEYFRNLETSLVREFETGEGYVVSCGGGAVLRQENVDSMKKNGRIVLLTAEPETVYARVRYGKNRPLLNGNMNVEYIASLMERRRACYEAAADIVIATDEKTPEKIAEEIVHGI